MNLLKKVYQPQCAAFSPREGKLLPSPELRDGHHSVCAKLSKPPRDPVVLASFTHCSQQFKVEMMLFDQCNQLISKVYRCRSIKFSVVLFLTEKSRR